MLKQDSFCSNSIKKVKFVYSANVKNVMDKKNSVHSVFYKNLRHRLKPSS